MKPLHIAIAASLSAFILSAPAHASAPDASASASASIKNLTFTLVDLDQTDGITPSIFFYVPYIHGPTNHRTSGNVNLTHVSAQGITTYSDGAISGQVTPQTYLITGDVTRNLLGSASSATGHSVISGDPFGSGGSLEATSAVTFDKSFPTLDRKASAKSTVEEAGTAFGLSANTRLVITGDYVIAASLTGAISPGDKANVTFRIDGDMGSWENPGSERAADDLYVFSRQTLQRSGTFSLAIDNIKSQTDYGFVRVSASTFASISAVPEPETWALMCAGLATSLIWRTRRNRSSQAAG